MTKDGHTQGTPAAGDSPAQERRVADLLDRRDEFSDITAYLAALHELLAVEPDLDEVTVARVALSLDGEDLPSTVEFWTQLGARFPDHALLTVCRANALLRDARDQEAMDCIAAALELDPRMVTELDDVAAVIAHEQGGAIWLRYQLAELYALLADIEDAAVSAASPSTGSGDAGDSGDSGGDAGALEDAEELGEEVRERYSELLDEYRDDPDALTRIRVLGAIITRLENEGLLPQCLIRRGGSRH